MTFFSRNLRQLSVTFAAAALFLVAAPLSAAAPPNDVCTGAVAIPANGPFPYNAPVLDTTGTTNDSGDPAFPCNSKFPTPAAGSVSHSVWYTFTPAVSDNYQIDTLGTQPSGVYDTILALFTGSCGNLTPVAGACNDDAAGSQQSLLQAHLTAGTTYTILVAGLGARDPMSTQVLPSPGGQLHLNVSRVAVAYPYSYIVPSVAHTQGLALWISDLNVTNLDGADGSFTIQFLNHADFGAPPVTFQPTTAPEAIRAGGSVLVPDVLSAMGVDPSTNPWGALLINSTVRLAAGARTYTSAAAGGTFGQYAFGVAAGGGEMVSNGENGRLIGVRDNSAFRTNLAVFNSSNLNCTAVFELLDSNGSTYPGGSQQTRVVPPVTVVQKNGIRDFFGTSQDVNNASIRITDQTPGCHLGAVAYVIDGATNDPFAVPLTK